MNINPFLSLRVSSVALLVAACGGSDGSEAGSDQNLDADSGAGGAEVDGAGGKAAGGSAPAASGGTPAGGSGGAAPGGSGGSTATGGSAPGGGGSDADAGSGGTGGAVADDGGVEGGGGAPGSGGSTADGGPTPVAPPPAGIVAFAYAGDPQSTSAYEPPPAYRFHQNAGTLTSHRTAAGQYTVRVLGLTVPMQNVQVTAYDQAAYCGVSSSGNETVVVRCYDFDGAAVDAQFSFLALGPSATQAAFTAYAWANDAGDAEYSPSDTYAFSASGGALTARRTAAGTYSLEFAGLSLLTGNVQVTAYGGTQHCNARQWSGNSVQVRCYDAAGALSDSRYQVLVAQSSAGAPEVQGYVTSVTAADPGGDLSGDGHTFNASGGRTVATRSGAGRYSVQFEGTTLSGGNVQVTPLGSNAYCNVILFAGDRVSVACYDAAGAAADSRFSLVAVR